MLNSGLIITESGCLLDPGCKGGFKKKKKSTFRLQSVALRRLDSRD